MADCSTVAPTWQKGPYGTDKYVNWVGISRTGDRVVAGTYYYNYGAQRRTRPVQASNEYGVYAYDRGGTLLFDDTITDPDGAYWVAISADGRYAAAGGGSSSAGGLVRAYDVDASAPGQPKVLLDWRQSGSNPARVSSVALSADGTWLVAGGDQLYIYQLYGGSYHQYNAWNNGADVISVAMSQDGQTIVYSDAAGCLYLVYNGRQLFRWTLPTPGKVVHFVSMSDDGGWFGAAGGDGRVYFFETSRVFTTGQPLWSYPPTPSPAPFYAVCVSPAGDYVSAAVNSGSAAGILYLLDASGNLQPGWPFTTQGNPNSTTIDGAAAIVTAATGHPDGTPGWFYALARDGSCRMQYQVDNMSWPMQVARDGSAMFAGGDTSCVYYWDLSSSR